MTSPGTEINRIYARDDRAGSAFLLRQRGQLCGERQWTYDHCLRTGGLARRFALHLGASKMAAENLGLAVSCHDVGKMAVSAEVLDSTNGLTPDERAMVRDHAWQGGAMLRVSCQPLARLAADIAENHHERWNGTGYAQKSGADIPLGAQIAALCDVFDSATSNRPYHAAAPAYPVLAGMLTARRPAFNPALLEPFVMFCIDDCKDQLAPWQVGDLLAKVKNPPCSPPHSTRPFPSPGVHP